MPDQREIIFVRNAEGTEGVFEALFPNNPPGRIDAAVQAGKRSMVQGPQVVMVYRLEPVFKVIGRYEDGKPVPVDG